MECSNSKVQGIVFILRAIQEQVQYLGVFCYKAMVMLTSMYA